MQNEYIVYACPLGQLAAQLDGYFAASLAACGPNSAHAYMPHCTLTGFFQDVPDAVPNYLNALEQTLAEAQPPAEVLRVLGMELRPDFHGLLLEGEWLKALLADFARRAESPTQTGALRLKDWLHLSLAYGFPAEQHEPLAALARELVDPFASARWELRFYQRHPDKSWTELASWPLT